MLVTEIASCAILHSFLMSGFQVMYMKEFICNCRQMGMEAIYCYYFLHQFVNSTYLFLCLNKIN